jgi:hypothetical protein
VRRALAFFLPFGLAACGLLSDFDGLTDNYNAAAPDDPNQPDTGRKREGGSEASSDVDAAPCTPAPPTKCTVTGEVIACEDGPIYAVAATENGILWLSQRGAIFRGKSKEHCVVQSFPADGTGGSAIAIPGAFAWAFQRTTLEPVHTCSDVTCGEERLLRGVKNVQRLARSAAGIFAWGASGEVAPTLFAIEPNNAFEIPSSDEVTHFAVTSSRAFWRVEEENRKRSCEIANCIGTFTDPAQKTGQAPLASLGGDQGFVGVTRNRNEESVPVDSTIHRCPDLDHCNGVVDLPFIDDADFDKGDNADILLPSRIGVGPNDDIYVAGRSATAGQVTVAKASPAGGDPSLHTLAADSVASIAVSSSSVFVVTVTGTTSTIVEIARSTFP